MKKFRGSMGEGFLRGLMARRRARGFTLVELMVVLAIMGAAFAGYLFYQSMLAERNKANDTVKALVSMVGDIKTNYQPANTFVGVTSAALSQSGVVKPPFTTSGTTILDAWGQVVTVGGSPAFFGVSMSMPDSDTCMRLVSAMAQSALRLTIHTAAPSFSTSATTPAAFLPVGTVVKADATANYDPANASAGCGAAQRHVSMVFR